MLKNKSILVFCFFSVLIFSCTKEANDKLDQLEKFERFDPSTQAQVKFINAFTTLTLNGASASTIGFRLFMNTDKINGSLNTSSFTNSLRYGDTYPATTAYAFLPSGTQNFKFTMNRVSAGAFAPIAGDDIFTASQTLVNGKKYSIFVADPVPNPGMFMVEDNFNVPLRDKYALRFINLCGDAASRFDLFSFRQGLLFSNVGNKEMKDYTYLFQPSVSDTIQLRLAGTSTVVSTVNTFTAGSQKVYTFYARGKTGVTGRTPSVTFYTNR